MYGAAIEQEWLAIDRCLIFPYIKSKGEIIKIITSQYPYELIFYFYILIVGLFRLIGLLAKFEDMLMQLSERLYMVALFTLRLNNLQAKSHDKKTPAFIMGNVRYRIKVNIKQGCFDQWIRSGLWKMRMYLPQYNLF